MDFTNLDLARSKDGYPLLKNHSLIESVVGYSIMSFMDTFLSYHQIRIILDNSTITSLISLKGLHYYKVMHYRLMNLWVSYQRKMDRVFKDRKGRKLVVFLDDLFMMNKFPNQHEEDLKELFFTLKMYNI